MRTTEKYGLVHETTANGAHQSVGIYIHVYVHVCADALYQPIWMDMCTGHAIYLLASRASLPSCSNGNIHVCIFVTHTAHIVMFYVHDRLGFFIP